MKVVIVNPPAVGAEKFIREGRCEQRASSFQYLMVPISLPSIASLLRQKKFMVELYDCMAEDWDLTKTVAVIKKSAPGMVIINYSTATFNGDKIFTTRLKKVLPKTHLVAIGVHVTTMPRETLADTNLDSIIRGEPEITALRLAENLRDGKSLKNVEGLSFKGSPSYVSNPDRPFLTNLDILPFPARDLLKNYRYKMPVYNRPYTLVITARGCPNNCSFCTAKLYYGSKIRMRSPKNVLDEIEEIIKVYKILDITFWADTFTYDSKYVHQICQGIKARKLKFRWMCNARVDRVNPKMLKEMKETGCQIISFGVESGVQKILDRIGKNITLTQVTQTFKWVREAGIESAAHIIFGLPGETKDTIKQTIKFVKKINPDYVQFYSAIPFPGTDLYKEATEKGWNTAENWQDYELGKNILTTPELSAEDLGKLRKKAYLEFYLRPNYIFKKLRNFVKKPADLWPFIKQACSFLKDWVGKE